MSTEEDLIEDLKGIGVTVSSVWDFVNGPNDYDEALPILVQYLESVGRVRFKEGIARALGVKGFKDATYPLMREFRKSNDDGYKWAIANSLSIIVPKEALDDLIEALKDDEVAGHAVGALGLIGEKSAVEPIRPFLQHKMRWVRKAAETSLRRIERKAKKRREE